MADINLGVGGANSATGGYEIDNSLKLEADNSEYLEKANDSGTNRKTFTVSMWFKRTELSNDYMQLWQGGVNGEATRLGFYGGTPKEAIWVDIGGGTGNTGTLYRSYSTQVLRDTSAWYHIVLAVDTTQATEANRFKLWLNGSEVTDWSQRQYPAQDFQCALEASINMRWGTYDATYYKMCGYIAECHYLDGVAKVQTDFGEYDEDSGIWIPKEYTGSYGGNGCYLDFEDSSSLGTDQSGNGNDFTLNNITAVDQATDTPTNNFCTAFVDQYYNSTDSISHTEGGTKLTTASGTGWRTNMATMSLSSGKWYFEAKHPGTIDGDAIMTSIVPTARFTNSAYAGFYGGQSSGDGLGFYWDSTRFRYDDGSTISPPTNTISSGDILSIALDMDNNYVYSRINGGAWHNNGSANGDPTSGSSGTGGFAVADEPHMICTSMYSPSKNFFVNFGGYNAFPVSSSASDANGYGNFEYAPPSGYYAICSKNLAEYG